MNKSNKFGHYFNHWCQRVEGITQKFEHLLVTTLMQLPPCHINVHHHIITTIPPYWRTRTRSNQAITPPPLLSTPPPKRLRPSLQQYHLRKKQYASISNDASTTAVATAPALNDALMEITNMNWWKTPEAWRYFGIHNPRCKEEKDVLVKELMLNRIRRFKNGFLTSGGWREVVEDGDIKNKAGAFFIFQIKRRCKYLYHALSIALIKKSNQDTKSITWRQCCKEAVEKIRENESYDFSGVYSDDENEIEKIEDQTNLWVCDQTVMRWFRDFRYHGEYF